MTHRQSSSSNQDEDELREIELEDRDQQMQGQEEVEQPIQLAMDVGLLANDQQRHPLNVMNEPNPFDEEEEGEDLFAEGYERDYLNPSDDEEIATEGEDDSFIVYSEESDENTGGGGALPPAWVVQRRQRFEDAMRDQWQENIQGRLEQEGRRFKRRRSEDSEDQRSSAIVTDDIQSSISSSSSSPEPIQRHDDMIDLNELDSNNYSEEEEKGPAVALGVSIHSADNTEGSTNHHQRTEQRHTDEVYSQGEWMPQFEWHSVPLRNVSEWLLQEVPRCVVKNRLFNLLLFYTTNTAQRDDFLRNNASLSTGTNPTSTNSLAMATPSVTPLPDYQARIREMIQQNAGSFQLSFSHLTQICDGYLARWLIVSPTVMLELMDEVATFVTLRRLFPQYRSVQRRIQVHITDFPICDAIRDFRQSHRNVLVCVHGVVIRRSPVHPQLYLVRYNCAKCQTLIGPVLCRGDMGQQYSGSGSISQCPACHGRGPFRVNAAQTEFRNHQTLLLQEAPGQVPPGRLPRSLEVILVGDLIDRVRPGDHIEVVGVYRNSFDPLLNHRQGFPIFTTLLVANNVKNRAITGSSNQRGSMLGPLHSSSSSDDRLMTEQDRRHFHRLASHPLIKRKLIQSIAPSVHGRDDIKLGLLLALMGGVPKHVDHTQGHRIRGDINVLLVGDPGTAKSQFLKFVEQTAERAVYTTGRGSTAVGLTAAVHRDPISGEFALEGGALVVADRGVCLIDEFDKMSDQDRVSIHEAMEQQTISIARAGIVASLNARCSVIAAANPLHGRYDPSLSFDINVDLSPPILSRFDLLFVVRDEVDPDADTQLAQFVCASHASSHPYATTMQTVAEHHAINITPSTATVSQVDEDPSSDLPLPQSTLQAYIAYCRHAVQPSLARTQRSALVRLYRDLRQEHSGGGIRIAVRHLESMLRMAEAHARIFLRDYVTESDVKAAMSLFLRCFLSTQKYSMRQELTNKFRKYLEGDMEPTPLLLHRLQGIVREMRSVETRLTGVAPVVVRVDVVHMTEAAHGLSLGMDAVEEFYASNVFKESFKMVRHSDGKVNYIEHCLGIV